MKGNLQAKFPREARMENWMNMATSTWLTAISRWLCGADGAVPGSGGEIAGVAGVMAVWI